MPDCDYCRESFQDEQQYLEHLSDAHEGELGAIDRRRVEKAVGSDDSEGLPTGPLILGGVLLFAAVLVAYVLLGLNGTSGGPAGTVNGFEVAQTPVPGGDSAHGHGLTNVTIDGEQIDFSQSQYQGQARGFHFEGGNGRMWHKHANSVTLEYAMATLGIGVTTDTVTFDGTTYRDSDPGTNVTVTIDGEPVNPARHELSGAGESNPQDGDFIKIVVKTDE